MTHTIWQTIQDHKDAPTTCGVYQYWAKEKLLYIGKAINLKARLASHAQNARLDEKERAIVEGATEIKYTEVDSEFLALLLESELIRKYQPPYNRIWKDDKTYLYIVIDTNDDFPRPHLARAHTIKITYNQTSISKQRVFGPFPSTQVADEVLRAIRRLIPFCTNKRIGKHPCFYSKIGLCSPCPSTVSQQPSTMYHALRTKYRHQIRQVIKILSGKIDPVIKDLTREMRLASANQDFETALKLRTKIEHFTRFVHSHTFRDSSTISYNTADLKLQSLNKIINSITPNRNTGIPEHWNTNLHRIEFYDASNSALHDATVSMVVATDGLLDRGQYRRFKIKNPRANNDFDRLGEAMTRRLKNKSWPRPDLIVIDGGTPQLRALQPIFDLLPEPILYLGLAKHPDRLVVPILANASDRNFATQKIDLTQPGFQLITELRDEAHRFANSYRLLLESKRTNLKSASV